MFVVDLCYIGNKGLLNKYEIYLNFDRTLQDFNRYNNIIESEVVDVSFKRSTDMAKLPKVSGNLTYPEGYTRKQKEYCKRLISQLQEAEMICDFDINLVYRYTTTKFMLEDLDKQLAAVGVANYKEYGQLLKMYTSLSSTYIALSKELGLTPRNNRLKSNIDKREVLDTNIVSDEEEIDMEGWCFEDDED